MDRTPVRLPRALARRPKQVALAAATLAVLASGTSVAVAFGDSTDAPEGTANAATRPDARTSPPATPRPEGDPDTLRQARTERDDAVADATRSTQVSAAPATQEPEPGPQDTGSDASLTPTGQGGRCEASMYGDPQPTASGETFDPSALTAAHKTLPFDTMVRVTNTANGQSVTVRINDRGPYIAGRCLDLSTAAFSVIASPSQGVAQVSWEVVS